MTINLFHHIDDHNIWHNYLQNNYCRHYAQYTTVTGFALDFKNETPQLSPTVFGIIPWPIWRFKYQFHVIFSQLLLPYTDSFPSQFRFNMHLMCIFIFKKKINNSHMTSMMHIIFPGPSTKFPNFPDQINSPTFCDFRVCENPRLIIIIHRSFSVQIFRTPLIVQNCQHLIHTVFDKNAIVNFWSLTKS